MPYAAADMPRGYVDWTVYPVAQMATEILSMLRAVRPAATPKYLGAALIRLRLSPGAGRR